LSEESFTYVSFVLHDFDEIGKALDRIEQDTRSGRILKRVLLRSDRILGD